MARTCKHCIENIPSFKDSATVFHKKKFCSFDCMAKWGLAQAAMKKEKERIANEQWTKDFKHRVATNTVEPEKVSDWLKKCEKKVNAYIRLRDNGKPCISCDWPDDGSNQRHASHFRSVGACSSLRFNTLNIHASCAQCNSSKSGNISEYRPRLVDKIGIEMVEWIESQPKQKRYGIDYLKKLYKTFHRLIKREEKRIKRTDYN